MRVLITGASGFVGTKLFTTFRQQGHEVVGTSLTHLSDNLQPLDINDKTAIKSLFDKEKPELVIHCAGIARPNTCQVNPDKARKVNVEGTINIVNACKETGALLVYPSSVYVFAGGKDNPQREKDEVKPINVYGETKAEAERIIEEGLPNNHIITRTDMLYGYNGQGMENGFFGVIAKEQSIKLDDKNIRQPLFVNDLAEAIQTLLRNRFSGIIHLAGEEKITQYALGRSLEQLIRNDSHIIKDGNEHGVPRPKNSLMDDSIARSFKIRFTPMKESMSTIKEQMKTRSVEGGFTSVES